MAKLGIAKYMRVSIGCRFPSVSKANLRPDISSEGWFEVGIKLYAFFPLFEAHTQSLGFSLRKNRNREKS